MSNTVWSFAKLGVECRLSLVGAHGPGAGKLPQFEVQSLSNTARSFSKCLYAGSAVTRRALPAGCSRAAQFRPQCLANALWRTGPPPTVERIPAVMGFFVRVCLTTQFNAQNISNTPWSLARLGVPEAPSPALPHSIACHDLAEFDGQNISNRARWLCSVGLPEQLLPSAVGMAKVAKRPAPSEQDGMG
eukprot:UN4938